MAILLLQSSLTITASKRRPSRRKPKRAAFPRLLLKRAISSIASSPFVSRLPPPLDLLPPLINGSRGRMGSFRGRPWFFISSAASASVLGYNVKNIVGIKFRVVLPEMGSAAGYFLLGFLLCFLICKAIFAPRRWRGWRL